MGRFAKEKSKEDTMTPSSTDPYTQKPFPGLGAATAPEALSQRFIFPTDAAAQNLVTLRAIAGDFFMRSSASARADFSTLAPLLVERIIKKNYVGDRLGVNLYEFAYGREVNDPRDILISLYGAFHSKRLLEVGYRSTRLDPYGKPILRPRVYLGSVRELNESTVLLETAYGLRRFFIKDLAWAAISPSHSVNLSGVEIKITGTKEAPFFSVHILQQSEILKDEPREVFFQEQTEEEPKPFTSVTGGLRRVPLNSSTIRFLIPYFHKDVYLEAYDLKGGLWYSGLFHLEKGDWNSHREHGVVLWNDRNEKQVQLKNGHLFIGLPEDLPENNL